VLGPLLGFGLFCFGLIWFNLVWFGGVWFGGVGLCSGLGWVGGVCSPRGRAELAPPGAAGGDLEHVVARFRVAVDRRS